jgi:hypothetical protein
MNFGFFKSHKDVPYTQVKELKDLKLAFDKRDEGKTKYMDHVYNKMKPKWLFQ